MARKKRTSTALEKARIRIASLKSIDANLSLNGEVTLASYKEQADDTEAKLELYNTKLSELDKLLNDLQASEVLLNAISARILAGVGFVYGKDSNEYEQAGGTRTSEIARKSPSNGS